MVESYSTILIWPNVKLAKHNRRNFSLLSRWLIQNIHALSRSISNKFQQQEINHIYPQNRMKVFRAISGNRFFVFVFVFRYFIKSLTPGQEKHYIHKPEHFYSYSRVITAQRWILFLKTSPEHDSTRCLF